MTGSCFMQKRKICLALMQRKNQTFLLPFKTEYAEQGLIALESVAIIIIFLRLLIAAAFRLHLCYGKAELNSEITRVRRK